MEHENEMILTNADGKDVVCKIVADFTLYNKHYFAYTDGTLADDGKEELYVSRYENENGIFKLIEITDKHEWENVDKYLDKYLFDED